MNLLRVSASAAALCAAAFMAGCATSKTAAPAKAGKQCVRGTLGIEASPITREMRKTLGLPSDFQGAVVAEVLPRSPAAAAGVRQNDIVSEVGSARIGNECELSDAAYGRSCDPVRVVLRRAGEAVEATLVPVDQDSFYEKSCADGIPSGCFRQGWLLWSRNRDDDRQRALGLYEKGCRGGSADACAYEGLRLMDSPDRGNDAIAALERACELDSGAGCAHLAFLYATGKFVTKDDRRATALYVKACDLGDGRGCYNVGLMADEGRGTARDHSQAAALYDEACQQGSSTACTNLGFLYENGRGVKKDRARAVVLYQRGCDGSSCQPSNLGGCLNVGRALRDGIGVEKDAARAAQIFQGACERQPDHDDTHSDTNRSRACSLLGGLYLAGDGVEKDVAKGRELSELGCERGDSFGCFNAAVVATDPTKAAEFLDRACKAGDGEGCNDLGTAYEKGNGVARDRRRARELFKKACDLGFTQACKKKSP